MRLLIALCGPSPVNATCLITNVMHLLQQRLALAHAGAGRAVEVRQQAPHGGRRAAGTHRARQRVRHAALQRSALAALAACAQPGSLVPVMHLAQLVYQLCMSPRCDRCLRTAWLHLF